MISKIIKTVLIVVGVVAIAMLAVKGLSHEDDWICVSGEWVKHGAPRTLKPAGICGDHRADEFVAAQLYFNNDKMDPEFSCNKVFPVERIVPESKSSPQEILELLLLGPTVEEKERGFFTTINPGVKIQQLSIKNGVAKVDFDEQLEYHMGGSCRVAAIRWEIIETLKQFPNVQNVIISINGRTEDILQP